VAADDAERGVNLESFPVDELAATGIGEAAACELLPQSIRWTD
jgi:hypothetical protein